MGDLKYPPLRSHGLFDEEWVPPKSKSRFVQYDRKDEWWMRPAGLGSVKRFPANMFDVRLFGDDRLVGYVQNNPQYGRDVTIRALDQEDMICRSPREIPLFMEKTTVAYLRNALFSVGGEILCCWMCSAEDAVILIRCKIIVAGPDMIHEL